MVKPVRFFWLSLITMLIWNAGTTWWIWNSTGPGAVGAIAANSLLMTIPLCCFHACKRKYGNGVGLVGFIVFWLSFEYIHLNWQLSWPWLTLGNVFAVKPHWVQWYELTGVSGGSLWVLLTNVLLFVVIKNRGTWKPVLRAALIIALPLIVSSSLSSRHKTTPSSNILGASNVVIVQPDIDPYNEKFDAATTSAQIEKLISLSEQQVDTNTRLVLWPETALPVPVWQNEVAQTASYQPVFNFVKRHPNVMLETGIEVSKSYGTTKATITARKHEPTGTYYDAFNAAVAIKAGEPLQFYYKSKLVPGVETLPDFLQWMSAVFEKFGGTTGGYGHDTASTAFKMAACPYATAPIICYESIYGEYISTYVRKGANLLTIITNDGWWLNTPGHRQHLHYARLRAIETRKWIARSANTGISAIINSNGDILDTRLWDKAASMKYAIPAVEGETWYVRHGDLIFRVALYIAIAMLVYHFVLLMRKRFGKKAG